MSLIAAAVTFFFGIFLAGSTAYRLGLEFSGRSRKEVATDGLWIALGACLALTALRSLGA